MSAFLGFVRLGTGSAFPDTLALPDQLRLGPLRTWTGRGAGLVHRQRINTPEDRHEMQPTPVWGGSGAILFDGRLDDRAGLCRDLGLTLRESLPDSELVARAFEKWDTGAASKLIGNFALAAWDGTNRRAILCADQGGTRPLYFQRSGSQLSFSTVLPALLSIPKVRCELDQPVIADFLFDHFHDSRASFFRGIDRVLQGTVIVLSESGENVIKYWRPGQSPPLALRSDEEYVEAAREVLDRAVASRLRSLAPVPMMGSGGIDSSCILVSVLGQTNAAVPLFTAVPECGLSAVRPGNKYADERGVVMAMQAAFPRLAPRFIAPAERPDMEFDPERIFDETAAPLFNIMATGWWETTFGPMRDQGATACLAGHMGNKTLSWDGQIVLSSLFRRGRLLRMASEAHALSGRRPGRTARALLNAALGPQISIAFGDDNWRKHIALSSRAEAELTMQDRVKASGDKRYKIPRDGREQRLLGLTSRRAVTAETMAWARARHGIETRDPLDDVRLIDFCMSIPEDQYLRRGQTRWLARRLLRDAGVPAEIAENTRRGAWQPGSPSRFAKRRPGFAGEIARLRKSPVAGRLMDLELLTRLASAPQPLPEGYPVLLRALHVGAFIVWAEARSRTAEVSHKYPSLAITAP